MDSMSFSTKIVLVIPCYNEEKRLPVEKYIDFIDSRSGLSLVFVDDGSTDRTAEYLETIRRAAPRSVRLASIEKNVGKAEAVRHGVLLAASSIEYELLGYWDADLSTPLTELPLFVEAFHQRPCQFVSGARILRMGGDISRHWYRHYLGRSFATATSIALNLPYYDTQCGAKMFRREMIDVLFEKPFLSHWLFDIELIFRLKKTIPEEQIQKLFYEVPLTSWRDIPGSKLALTDYLRAPYELFQIWRQYS